MDARVLSCGLFVAALSGVAGATPIDTRDFFNPYSPTITTWENDGSGVPVTLLEGESRNLPAAEYLSRGFMFSQPIAWVNDANGSFNGAQALVGTPNNAIPSASFNTFDILFTDGTDAFGFVVVNNISATVLPSFTAYDAQNQAIQTVTWGPSFIDGTLGVAQYGFMGIYSPDAKIARVSVIKQFAILDDFLFATVPTPGAAGILGLGLLTLGRRKR